MKAWTLYQDTDGMVSDYKKSEMYSSYKDVPSFTQDLRTEEDTRNLIKSQHIMEKFEFYEQHIYILYFKLSQFFVRFSQFIFILLLKICHYILSIFGYFHEST